MAILKTVLIVLEVLLLFNLLIAVHELGHFLAAKWRGLKIDRFAVWFGKPIWKRTVGGVEYALGWIPAGGYVALPQMASMEAIEGKSDTAHESLPPVSAIDKIIVAFAGPLFSFLLAFCFACLVWAVGKPVNRDADTTTIGWVDQDGPAWDAGLRPGDKILKIDGFPVTTFGGATQDSIMWRIITSEGTNVSILFERDGQEHTVSVAPIQRPTKWYERKSLRQILVRPEIPSIIFDVATNSPAALAGLRSGDQVVALDGEKVYHPERIAQLEDSMSNSPPVPMILTVQRDGRLFDRTITPVEPLQPTNSPPRLGIVGWQADTNVVLIHPGPWEQVQESAGQIFATLGAVMSPKTSVGVQQLGGAVMIMRLYKNLFESEHGWQLVLYFSVVINVNLAMLNLLPLPVLDGGHIFLSLLEVIRRRPLNPRFLQAIQTGFAVLLIAFMLFIAFFDTGDWIRSAKADRAQPVIFAPQP